MNKKQCLVGFNNPKDPNYTNFKALEDCGAYKVHVDQIDPYNYVEYAIDIDEIEDIGKFVDKVNEALFPPNIWDVYSAVLSFAPVQIFLDKV
jgi:hypothetical protein